MTDISNTDREGTAAVEAKPGYKPVGAARSAVRILRFLAGEPQPLGVTAIARALDIYPGTCFNILKTLHEEHFVAFDPATKTYGLGHGVLELSHGLLRSSGYLDSVRPRLRRLCADFAVTTYLFKVDDRDHVVIVDAVGSGTAIDVQVSVGRRLSPYQGAMGRVVAAHRGKRARDIAATLDRIPWQDRPSDDSFDADVAQASLKGFGVDRDHMVRGLSSVAVPIVRNDGHLSLILSAIGLTSDLGDPRLAALAAEMSDIARTFPSAFSLMRD